MHNKDPFGFDFAALPTIDFECTYVDIYDRLLSLLAIGVLRFTIHSSFDWFVSDR